MVEHARDKNIYLQGWGSLRNPTGEKRYMLMGLSRHYRYIIVSGP